ncbi:MAG: hypothetical protein ABEJ65_00480 [bacterium]
MGAEKFDMPFSWDRLSERCRDIVQFSQKLGEQYDGPFLVCDYFFVALLQNEYPLFCFVLDFVGYNVEKSRQNIVNNSCWFDGEADYDDGKIDSSFHTMLEYGLWRAKQLHRETIVLDDLILEGLPYFSDLTKSHLVRKEKNVPSYSPGQDYSHTLPTEQLPTYIDPDENNPWATVEDLLPKFIRAREEARQELIQ